MEGQTWSPKMFLVRQLWHGLCWVPNEDFVGVWDQHFFLTYFSYPNKNKSRKPCERIESMFATTTRHVLQVSYTQRMWTEMENMIWKKNPYPGLRYAIEKIEFMTTDISCHDFPRKNENRLKPGVYHWKIYALNRWTYLKIIDLWQLKKDSWCLHWRMKTGDGKLMVYILYT